MSPDQRTRRCNAPPSVPGPCRSPGTHSFGCTLTNSIMWHYQKQQIFGFDKNSWWKVNLWGLVQKKGHHQAGCSLTFGVGGVFEAGGASSCRSPSNSSSSSSASTKPGSSSSSTSKSSWRASSKGSSAPQMGIKFRQRRPAARRTKKLILWSIVWRTQKAFTVEINGYNYS